MAGICAMLITLRIYVGALYALLGLALPLCTKLIECGYEGRPYGLMYGCFGLATYSWAKLGEDDSHTVAWNVALGIALTAALACHFYSVFVLLAFYLGEAVRTIRRRSVSRPTATAFVSPTEPFEQTAFHRAHLRWLASHIAILTDGIH